jgi:outer membrane protein OmpA-like peptidoglycan-associated protein
LSGQKGWLSRLIPSGISAIPGLNTLAEFTGQAGAVVRDAAQHGEEAVRGAAREAYRETAALAQPARPWLSALLPLLLIALALGALPLTMRGCATKPISVARAPEVRVPAVRVPEVAIPERKDTVARVAGYRPDLGKLANIKLPDGANVEIPEASFLHGVYKFLSETGGSNSRTFVFEDLNFEGPSVKTVPATETAVKIVSTLLKAFPGVNVRIDGNTDSLGDPVANRRLSLEGANAVKEVLVKAGVPADRIRTEGLGPDKPIAPNDTEENRAKNRRIELTLERKDPVARVAGYGPDLGKLANIQLPNGVNVEIPETSFLHGVYKFLSEAGGSNSRTFVFEGLNFEGPWVKTVPATERAVNIVSALLKAFPGVNIRIDGHTDNMSDPVANRRLSLDRANAVKDVFIKAGVPADRIRTEGFGSDKPIAPNDTEENRAKNRRIELTLERIKA